VEGDVRSRKAAKNAALSPGYIAPNAFAADTGGRVLLAGIPNYVFRIAGAGTPGDDLPRLAVRTRGRAAGASG
jgi:hypothetical protein